MVDWKRMMTMMQKYFTTADTTVTHTNSPLVLLGTSAFLLLLALAVGRRLFYKYSSYYYGLLHRGDEQDIVQAAVTKKSAVAKAQTPKEEEEEDRDDTPLPLPSTTTTSSIPRNSDSFSSTDLQIPLVGWTVSFASTWERRKQTLAMFSCSLAFVLPMTIACWILTIYLAVVVPVLLSSQQQQQQQSTTTTMMMILSSLVWIYLIYVYGGWDLAPTTGSRKPWMRGGTTSADQVPGHRGGFGFWIQSQLRYLLRAWWALATDFLPVILVKTADLPAFMETKRSTATENAETDGNQTYVTATSVKPCKYVLGYHPHGIIAVGAFCAFATDSARVLDLSTPSSSSSSTKTPLQQQQQQESSSSSCSSSFSNQERRGFSSLYPGLDRRVVTLPQNFWTPFLREYFLSMGAITSAKQAFRRYLQTYSSDNEEEGDADGNDEKGRAMIVVVGGASESLMAEQGSINLVLRNRRGFVREAIMAGAHLVPVLGFGETNLYHLYSTDQKSFAAKMQRFIKKTFGFAAPMFRGRSIFLKEVGILPYRTPVVVVVGAPIAPPTNDELQGRECRDFAPKIDRSTDEALNADGKLLKEWHTRYVNALEALYNQHKDAQWNMPGKSRSKSMRILR